MQRCSGIIWSSKKGVWAQVCWKISEILLFLVFQSTRGSHLYFIAIDEEPWSVHGHLPWILELASTSPPNGCHELPRSPMTPFQPVSQMPCFDQKSPGWDNIWYIWLLQGATSPQRNAGREVLVCVWRAADTKAGAGSDMSPEESKRENMWWRAQNVGRWSNPSCDSKAAAEEAEKSAGNETSFRRKLNKRRETLPVSNKSQKCSISIVDYTIKKKKKKKVWHL